ncbi:MAG: hypothetical protein HQ539_02435 [Parcubacteria group bacterium]|nr:hypothetical protein [Parcubacteria group bacterium]
MPTKPLSFQDKKANLARRVSKNGLNASSCILFSLKDSKGGLLESLPSCYPGIALMQWTFGVGKYKKKGIEFKEETIRTNLRRLRKDGLITKDPKQKSYYLTDDGKKVVSHIRNRYLILKKKWDGKLRLVIFDVPEKKKYWRRSIREELLSMEYQLLQKSVYVGKYPLSQSFCKELDEAGLGSSIFIFTIDKADRKEKILKLLEK